MSELREIFVSAYKRKDGTLVNSHSRTIKVSLRRVNETRYVKKIINPNQLLLDLQQTLNNNKMNQPTTQIKNCADIITDLKKLKKENPNNFAFGSKARRYLDDLKIGKDFDWDYITKW